MPRWLREIGGLVLGLALVVGGFMAWQAWFGKGKGEGITAEKAEVIAAPVPDRRLMCDGLVGSAESRVSSCIERIGAPPWSAPALQELTEIAERGAALVIGTDPGLAGARRWSANEDADFFGNDEEVVAARLRDRGIRAVVVARDLTGAVDREGTVLSRLAHHDHLVWFQLRRVTEHALVYTVRGTAGEIGLLTGGSLVEGLRARLEGRRPSPQSWRPESIRLLGSVRLQGKTLLIRHAAAEDVELALDDLAVKMASRWSREVETLGMGSLRTRLPEARLEVQVVLERATVEPRSPWALFDLWELGIDGVMLRRAEGFDDDKFSYLPGSEATIRGIRSPEAFFAAVAREFEWAKESPWEDPRVRMELFRTQHFMERDPGGRSGVVKMVRGTPEVLMADLTDSRIRDMLVEGGEWWLANMRPDGKINYKIWPDQNRVSDDYNEVRHILATRDLADVWRYRQDPRYLAGARRAMDWLMRYAIRDTDPAHSVLPSPPAGTLLFRYPLTQPHPAAKMPNQKLGTVAVALLGWIAWAEATGDHREDENIRAMARFVQSRLEPNGRFDPYFVQVGHPYYNQKNDIVPGEAALALGKVAAYFNEPEWLNFYPRFLDYYEPWFRERAARQVAGGRWPHGTYDNQDRLDLVQFGPWSVMAANQAYAVTGDRRAAAFGLEVADWMIDNYQWSAARSPYPDYVGGYYKMPTELPAMQTFCYSEGTAAAYALASRFRPEQKGRYDLSTREAVRFLDVMQYDATSAYFVARPELAVGGIRYAMNEPKIRIDYVGHGLSTLSQYLDARRADPAVKLDLPVEVVQAEVLPPGEEALATAAPEALRPTDGAEEAEDEE